MTFENCWFQDGGETFVDVLEHRQTRLGTLSFPYNTPFHKDHLKRLIQANKAEQLILPRLDDELDLLPISAPVQSLTYEVAFSSLVGTDFENVNIETDKLFLSVYNESDDFPTELMISIWKRIGALGHFKELGVRVPVDQEVYEQFGCEVANSRVMKEAIRAIIAYPGLTTLQFGDPDGCEDWDSYLEDLFDKQEETKRFEH
ncbi:hypothetical protein FisN_7Hu304 [Fistulifera solaris]|jgi:hypothetical protein|uniref:Uncharacterized protein n=1 Tax=Fistulifera solaris TaxID=1519565 RepID=A0A1Z5KS37_FISSO|nr:hypothetical protein FisN_7Hu304 [Fistulifera solaris]|eukprot:GAX29099.1 hypothetical protein FisN_7Hu304 [Fistulifera solaris]